MPFGGFLDDFPTALFVGIHVMMIPVGLWAIWRTSKAKVKLAAPLWLYVASQPLFLLYWADVLILKITAVLEQTLIIIMIVWLAAIAGRVKSRTHVS